MRTLEKLKNFFEIASLRCACCGELGHTEAGDGKNKLIISPEYYGIYTIADYYEKMDEYLEWMIDNKDDVLETLPELEDEWKENCKAVREILKLKW